MLPHKEKVISFLERIPIVGHILDFYGFVKNMNLIINTELLTLRKILTDNYLKQNLYCHPVYQDDKRLNKYEYQVYSQNGEDGIIEEIFKRIGTSSKFFVELGVENGLECNTAFLLIKGWRGAWIEGSKKYVDQINKRFFSLINSRTLKVKEAFINSENIESLFLKLKVPDEFDFLSIDIDGNDYWVWKAISKYRPKVVAIEYNAMYPANVKWVMKYNPNHIWGKNSHQGASLRSLEVLAREKNYILVGCNFHGTNAFFVSNEYKDHFLNPSTVETHYEPLRQHLICKMGHPREFRDFEII